MTRQEFYNYIRRYFNVLFDHDLYAIVPENRFSGSTTHLTNKFEEVETAFANSLDIDLNSFKMLNTGINRNKLDDINDLFTIMPNVKRLIEEYFDKLKVEFPGYVIGAVSLDGMKTTIDDNIETIKQNFSSEWIDIMNVYYNEGSPICSNDEDDSIEEREELNWIEHERKMMEQFSISTFIELLIHVNNGLLSEKIIDGFLNELDEDTDLYDRYNSYCMKFIETYLADIRLVNKATNIVDRFEKDVIESSGVDLDDSNTIKSFNFISTKNDERFNTLTFQSTEIRKYDKFICIEYCLQFALNANAIDSMQKKWNAFIDLNRFNEYKNKNVHHKTFPDAYSNSHRPLSLILGSRSPAKLYGKDFSVNGYETKYLFMNNEFKDFGFSYQRSKCDSIVLIVPLNWVSIHADPADIDAFLPKMS